MRSATVGHGGHDLSTETWTMQQYDDFCTANAESWFAYAATEPRVGGVLPWCEFTGSPVLACTHVDCMTYQHFRRAYIVPLLLDWCMSAPERPCYYPEPKTVPRLNVTYGFGLDQMPKCTAAFVAWGKKVNAHVPGGHIRPHQPASTPANDGRAVGSLCKTGAPSKHLLRTRTVHYLSFRLASYSVVHEHRCGETQAVALRPDLTGLGDEPWLLRHTPLVSSLA